MSIIYCNTCTARHKPELAVLMRCGTCAVINGKLPPTKYVPKQKGTDMTKELITYLHSIFISEEITSVKAREIAAAIESLQARIDALDQANGDLPEAQAMLMSQCKTLTQDNAALKRANLDCMDHFYALREDYDKALARIAEMEKQEPVEIDWPDYHSEAMGCGLEDHGIRDRYEAVRYGWDQAIEHAAERLPEKLFVAPVPPVRNEWKDAVLDTVAAYSMDFPVDTHPTVIVNQLIGMAVTMAKDPAIRGEI